MKLHQKQTLEYIIQEATPQESSADEMRHQPGQQRLKKTERLLSQFSLRKKLKVIKRYIITESRLTPFLKARHAIQELELSRRGGF